MPNLVILALAAAVVIAGLLIALTAAVRQNALFRRELDAARAGQVPSDVAFRRLADALIKSGSALIGWRLILAPVLIVVLVVVPTVLSQSGGADFAAYAPTIGVLLIGFGVALFAGRTCFEQLTVASHARVQRELRGAPITPGLVRAARVRRALLLNLPMMLIIVGLGVAISLPNLTFNILIGVLGGAVIVLFTALLLAQGANPWITVSLPIAATPHAALAGRVADWARLAGVATPATRVYYAIGYGANNVFLTGLGRPVVMFSDYFLANSDWRQQDAMIAFILGSRRMGVMRRNTTRLLIAVGVITAALIGFFLATNALIDLAPNSLGVQLLVDLAPVVVIIALLALLVARLGGASRNRWSPDRFSAALTGDPLALIVAINTLNSLNGLALNPTVLRSTAGRVAVLDQLVRAPGPKAPYAAELVPSIAPVSIGPYAITVPLGQAPPPRPIPTENYGPLPTK